MPDEIGVESTTEMDLNGLALKLSRRVLRKALTEAITVIGNDVLERLQPHTKHGDLAAAAAISVSVAASELRGFAAFGFGPQGFVARMLEFGHNEASHKGGISGPKVTGGHVPAYPFMRPAFDATHEAAVEAFAEVVRNGEI